MGHAKCVRHPRYRARFAGGFAPKAVVDGDGEQPRAGFARLTPARRQQQQRGGIGTAGDGEDKSGSACERIKQRLRLGGGDRRRIVSSGHASVLARHPA
jgi:hypothetical protein